jgi:putative Mn2+ efflux pump MntP
MVAIGWVMLKVVPFPPIYPVWAAALFTVWSGVDYVREGLRHLSESGAHAPADPGDS